MAKKEKIKLDPIENSPKKKSKFDQFVDKYFAPGPNTDFLDIFSLMGLALYGVLKLISKTRIKYKKWKSRNNVLKEAQKKMTRIRAARDRNFDKAKTLDDITPEVRKQAREYAKNMIKSKSPSAKGKTENDLTLEFAKMMQSEANRKNDQNPWVESWKASAEREMREEIYQGKAPGKSQLTQQYVDYVNSPLWLQERVNARVKQYVNEMVMEDPTLKGQEEELQQRLYTEAYEQAVADRNLTNDLYKWQDETRSAMLQDVMVRAEAAKREQAKEAVQVKAEEKEVQGEKKQEEKKPVEKKQEEKVQENPPKAAENKEKADQVKPQVPVAKQQLMPRWWSGQVLDIFLQTELKAPTVGEQESNERREFRESVEKLSEATKDPSKKGDLLVNEYVDVYVKASKFDDYLNTHPDSPEQGKGRGFTTNVIETLNYNNRFNKYFDMQDQDLSKVNNLAQQIAEMKGVAVKNKVTENKAVEKKEAGQKEAEKKNVYNRKHRNAFRITRHHNEPAQEEMGLGN